jgi:hypothetical protein
VRSACYLDDSTNARVPTKMFRGLGVLIFTYRGGRYSEIIPLTHRKKEKPRVAPELSPFKG